MTAMYQRVSTQIQAAMSMVHDSYNFVKLLGWEYWTVDTLVVTLMVSHIVVQMD